MTTRKKSEEIKAVLHEIAEQYPDNLKAAQHADVERIAFHIGLVIDERGRDGSLCDIGGGVGLFSVGCAALGMQVTLVDDFQDEVNREFDHGVLAVHQRYKVSVISNNVIEDDLDFAEACFDAVTSFDSMEHWHHSPKRLFRNVMRWLKPDGLFVLGVPNCVNLRKRITVPFGIGKWSRTQEWYEPETFRGHVREPDVADLQYIARDLNLRHHRIVGRNWLGYGSRSRLVRRLTPYADHILRLRPSLCSDIYLVGRS